MAINIAHFTDLENRVANACSERGCTLIRESADGVQVNHKYRVARTIDGVVVVPTNSVIATVRTFGRVVDPSL
jgi:hypothetical protein